MKVSNAILLAMMATGLVSAAPAKHKGHKEKGHKHEGHKHRSHKHESRKHKIKDGHGSRVDFPFSRMVAFGDNLSDNGNGSYAHGVADPSNPKDTIYGYRTWTDGPVAVSYLSDNLGIPLTLDYAFGGADGGSKIGATINNSYTSSMYAPDGFQQVRNYTTNAPNLQNNIGDTLHFVWIGNNDISLKHISTANDDNPAFANQMSDQMQDLIGRLVNAGAKYIFVVGLYAKNLSPSRQFMASNPSEVQNLGAAITEANTAIRQMVRKQFDNNVMYYDVFSFMTDVYNNALDYGIKFVLPDYCDGYSQKDWNICVTNGHGDQFYWMQYTDMTTTVDSLIAKDMAKSIRQQFND